MAESKFAGMFSQQQEEPRETKKRPAKAAATTVPVDTEPEAEPRAGKSVRAKPLSKSQDPDWKGFYVFLRKETHTEANYLLRKQDTGEDFSELMERLLSNWLKGAK